MMLAKASRVMSRQDDREHAVLDTVRDVRLDSDGFSSAEMGAIAHLYRGEVYRSTIWRTRLDNTTNWSIVTMGIALSTTFSSRDAPPFPLFLVSLLLAVFLVFEARRYRYFNVWRARARWLETNFYAPMLHGERPDENWRAVLARDYETPRHHISFARAVGRRLRRAYVWILAIQAVACFGKLAIHPTPSTSLGEIAERAAVGPIPGWAMLAFGVLYNLTWIGFGLATLWSDRRAHRNHAAVAMG